MAKRPATSAEMTAYVQKHGFESAARRFGAAHVLSLVNPGGPEAKAARQAAKAPRTTKLTLATEIASLRGLNNAQATRCIPELVKGNTLSELWEKLVDLHITREQRQLSSERVYRESLHRMYLRGVPMADGSARQPVERVN